MGSRPRGCIVAAAVARFACGEDAPTGAEAAASGGASGVTPAGGASGGGGPSAGAGGARFGECAGVAAMCAKFAECSPHVLKRAYGHFASCVARRSLLCLRITLRGLRRGARRHTCTDFHIGRIPAACDVPGPGAEGAPCASPSACASGSCASKDESGCGVCTPRQPARGPCRVLYDRQPGLSCKFGVGCAELKGAGESCDLRDLGRCYAETGLCAAPEYAAPGQPCDTSGPDWPRTFCVTSGTCLAGVCVAAAADGEACGQGKPGCMAGAACVDGRCAVTHPRCQ